MEYSIILWIQSPKEDNQSILSCNGRLIPQSSKNYQQYFNNVVVHNQKYKKLVVIEDSSVFQAETKNKQISYIVYSNFKEKDAVGRKIGYMARVDLPKCMKLQDIKEIIEKEAKMYGYTIELQPYVQLMKRSKKKRTKEMVVMTVSSLIILAVLIYVLTSLVPR